MEPCAIGSSSPNGTAAFSQLKPGIYLVSEASTIQGSYRYATSPCLISVPHMNAQETSWNYNMTAIPKIEQLPADVEDPNAPNASNSENANEAARTIRPFKNWRLHPAACAYAYGCRTCSICLHSSLPEQTPKTCICRQLSKYRNHHIERRNGVRRQQQRLTAPFWSIETDTIFPPKHSTQKVPLARLEPRPKT